MLSGMLVTAGASSPARLFGNAFRRRAGLERAARKYNDDSRRTFAISHRSTFRTSNRISRFQSGAAFGGLSRNYMQRGGGGCENDDFDGAVNTVTSGNNTKAHLTAIRRKYAAAAAAESATPQKVYLGIGSNVGDRYDNIRSALNLLANSSSSGHVLRIKRTSYLHETAPMYLTKQPAFLNGAIEIETTLPPRQLLTELKRVEQECGRDLVNGIRYGPRPVDLDILFYGNETVESDELVVPHPRMAERDFVLTPLCDIDEGLRHPVSDVSVGQMRERLRRDCDEGVVGGGAVRVLPLPRGRFLRFNETIVMGILNVTPDSFSDGGKLKGSVERAVETALQMEADGAHIIDIGGESTRPGAEEISTQTQIERTVPVIERIRQESQIPISIDTRSSQVASAAIVAGADIINDVSGGTHDPAILALAAERHVPIVLMHSRGTPETMRDMTRYDNDVVVDVAAESLARCDDAERRGVFRWNTVLDPGIGFAKDGDGNVTLLGGMDRFRDLCGDYPVLLGPSRKGFIGAIVGESNPAERDFGTVAACVAAICHGGEGGCWIVRVHNVKGVKQAVMVMDAIRGVR